MNNNLTSLLSNTSIPNSGGTSPSYAGGESKRMFLEPGDAPNLRGICTSLICVCGDICGDIGTCCALTRGSPLDIHTYSTHLQSLLTDNAGISHWITFSISCHSHIFRMSVCISSVSSVCALQNMRLTRAKKPLFVFTWGREGYSPCLVSVLVTILSL